MPSGSSSPARLATASRTARSRSAAAAALATVPRSVISTPPRAPTWRRSRSPRAPLARADGLLRLPELVQEHLQGGILEVIEVEDHRRRLFAGLARAAPTMSISARALRLEAVVRGAAVESGRPEDAARPTAPDAVEAPGVRTRDPPVVLLTPRWFSRPPGGSLDPRCSLLVRIAAFRVASNACCFFFNVANTSGSLSVLFILHARQEASPASSGLASSASSAARARAATAAVARARAAIFVAGSAGLASITPAGTQPTVMMWPSPGFGRSLVEAKCGASVPGGLFGGVTS